MQPPVPGPPGRPVPVPVPGPAAAARPVPGPPAAAAPVPGPPSPSAPDAGAESERTPLPPAVAAALGALEGVQDRPLHEHVEVYDEVHRRLQDALAALDER